MRAGLLTAAAAAAIVAHAFWRRRWRPPQAAAPSEAAPAVDQEEVVLTREQMLAAGGAGGNGDAGDVFKKQMYEGSVAQEEYVPAVDAADAPNAADFAAFLACIRADEQPAERLQQLLESRPIDLNMVTPGTDVFALSYLTIVLHEAADEVASACLRLLLAHEADPNAVDGTGRTALMYAAKLKNAAAVEALLDGGAQVRAAIDAAAEFAPSLKTMGRTALDMAVEEDALDCVEMLVARGADVASFAGRFSPLFLACLLGREACCTALLAANAPVEGADANGFTPLMAAADSGEAGCVKLLLTAGASHALAERAQQRTALMMACIAGGGAHRLRFDMAAPTEEAFVGCARALLEAGADAEARSTEQARGLTPLLYAAREGKTLVVRALLAHGIDPNARAQTSSEGLSALAMALTMGHEWTARVLCAHGAFPRVEPKGGAKGHSPLVTEFLLKQAKGHQPELVGKVLARMHGWLEERRGFCSSLHFTEELTPAHTRALLRAGADVRLRFARPKPANGRGHAEPAAGQGTLAELAALLLARLRQAGHTDAPACESAQLVVLAAEPWGPETHALFPARARQRAVDLLLLGAQLAKARPTADERRALAAAWSSGVLPRLVERNFLEPGTRVCVVGLSGATELNGLQGVVQCATATELAVGRVPVLLAGAKGGGARRVGVRAKHLSVVGDFAPASLRGLEAENAGDWARQWHSGQLYAAGRAGAP
ncbi:ankyrin repeat-containing domain protein [Pavlovales sp. CCMP2436]|nr:ankyrin repeat-containing domain protein [Pavlovales sp. CCMP2436]|mmetsp:Transcript_43267/g.106815  ORF Transcript_43267/g.106815 Transcript_43267/m.106815 type:complete len:720 (+) Transcript_43267:44-2203(+)